MKKTYQFRESKCFLSDFAWIIIICFAVIFLLFINRYLLTIAVVNGNSMYPTLMNGKILLVDRLHEDYSRGDIVLVRQDGTDNHLSYVIKRIIAVGGEMLSIDYKKNEVLVDGKLLLEPYINREEADPMLNAGNAEIVNYLVPDGCVFVMGDNRNHSTDSRDEQTGFILMEDIIGKIY